MIASRERRARDFVASTVVQIDPWSSSVDNRAFVADHQSKALAQSMPGPRPRRTSVVIALSLLVALEGPPAAFAWGRPGHRVISRLAEQHLTEKAKAGIKELLAGGESLADASTWADEHRSQLPKTAPRQYVDVPLDEPKYDKSGPQMIPRRAAWSTRSTNSG
jgi:S1/P1 Nuclease